MGGLAYFIFGFVSALVLIAATIIIVTIGWVISYSKYKRDKNQLKIKGKPLKIPKKPPWISHTDTF